jgi:two-component system phosphate regulon sensor histidine kinase PhoR
MNHWQISRLSALLAVETALTIAVIAWILQYFLRFPIGAPVVIGGISAAVVYGFAHFLLHGRIKRASTTLRQLRQHRFENLRPPAKTAGDELDELQREVFQTGRTFEKELKKLRKMEDYRREFLGNVSHELKTPIFSIQGFTETLLKGALNDPEVNERFVEKISSNTERLKSLTNDLSEIARLEMEDLQINIEPFDLFEFAREIIESLELQAKARDIDLQYEVSRHLPNVVGNREHLRQLLSNLVENGIKYNNPGGWVKLQAELQPNDDIRIAVSDDGIGIDEKKIPRLTERFYRVDKSRSRKQGGTGLGLAIVKHILEAHDRKLHIESQPGKGSTFWFSLPTN